MAVFGLPASAAAYLIAPKRPVHEALTFQAVACVGPAQGPEPVICRATAALLDREVLAERLTLDLSAIGLGRVPAKALEAAVRWPDDPTSEVAPGTIGKFGAKMLGACAGLTGGMNHGLLCSSHHGPLQFLHAMASSAEEPTPETEAKVLDWATFAYGVAAGVIDVEQSYCDYFGREGSASSIAAALRPADFFGCAAGRPRPWKVRTLFNLVCSNPFDSGTCWEQLDPRRARINAIGALLHVIQDSYAAGHTARGRCDLGALPAFECLPIAQFHAYPLQDADKHARADAAPIAGASCGPDATVDDPVLASARVLWHVRRGTPPAEVRRALAERVFRVSPSAPTAGPGQCFGK